MNEPEVLAVPQRPLHSKHAHQKQGFSFKTEPVILITGASRGIGAATALGAARAGYKVAVNCRANTLAADAVVSEIRAFDGTAITLQADIAVEAQVMAMFAKLDATFGPLTALVNCAGVVDVACRVDSMSVARLKRIFDTNIIGSIVCAREAIKRMSTRHGGSGGVIVNVSSVAAKLGAPGEYVDYAASKGAIDTFTVGLAREVAAEGIRVNGVRPGVIDTDIHASGGQPLRAKQLGASIPLQRAGTAVEVANAILWLLSSDASYATGALLDVSGGR